MSEKQAPKPESLIAQACHYIDRASGGIIPPIQPSTTYARDRDHKYIGAYSYSRAENPSWAVLEQVCAQLDGGAESLCFGSGMAAVTAFFDTLNSGEHLVAPRIMYHGSQDWLRRISEKRGFGLSMFDAGEAKGLQNSVKPGETTENGKLTQEFAECLGACEFAPCMLAGKTLHKNLTRESAEEFVNSVK